MFLQLSQFTYITNMHKGQHLAYLALIEKTTENDNGPYCDSFLKLLIRLVNNVKFLIRHRQTKSNLKNVTTVSLRPTRHIKNML